MAKINITASNVMASSGAYLELFNRDGLQVYAMKKGRFQIKCGSTHKVVRNTQELQEGIDGLGLHQFPHSGESVVSEINEKLSSTYRLEVRASNDKVVHMIEGSKDKIFGECIGTISVDKNMVPGRRYACNGIFGGDYMILVPMSAGSMCLDDSFSTSGDQMYEKQEFAKGVIVVGQNPLDGSTMTVLVDEVYPNGAFKDSEGIVWAKEDIKVYKFEVGRPTTNEDFKAPSESLYTEEDIPTYNPVGDVEKVAPMIGDLKNYDSILSASAGILSDFMKTAKSVAYIDRSSLNKVKISGINPEGQATDGEIEWNVRICSPHYKRSSNIMIPMVMTEGSIDLGKEFTASTGLKYPMTTEAIKEHLGTLIEGFEKKHRASRYPSTLKADKDIDNLMNGIEVKAVAATLDPDATYSVYIGNYAGTKEMLEKLIGNASDWYEVTEEELELDEQDKKVLTNPPYTEVKGVRWVSGEYLPGLINDIEKDDNVGDDITLINKDTSEQYDDWKEIRELIGGGKDKLDELMPDVEGAKKVAGKKVYRIRQGRGKGKYQVSFYDGVQKHKDGSAFFDLHIVNNKKELADFEQKLISEGYVEEGYDWKDEDYDKTRDETLQEMNLEQQEVNLYTNISEQDIRDRMKRDKGTQASKKTAGNSGAWMGPLKIFKDYSPNGFAYSVYVNGDYKGIYLGDDPTLVELGGPDWEDNVTEGENAPTASKKTGEYQPKTGEPCSCKPGIQRDNCPACEGTGMKIDFQKIRDSNNPAKKTAEALQSEDPSQNMGDRIKAAFAVSNYASEMETFDSVYEHGHWWISGTNKEGETSQFDAVDAEGQGAIDGFDFEKVASKKADLSPESLAQSIARGDSYALSKVSDSNRDAVKAALQKMGHDLAKVEELMQPVEAAKKTAEVGVDKQYVLTVKHDNGTINIQTSAQSEEGAISKVMKSEGCPRRSIVKVKEAARKTAETGGTIEVGYYWNVNADIDESSAKEDGLDLESDNYKAAADAALQAEFNVEKWLKQNLGAAPNTGSDEYGLGGSLWVAKGSPQHKFVMAGLRDNGEESFSTSSGTMPMDDDVLFAGVEDKFASVLNVDLYFMRMTNQPPENNDYSDEPEGDASAIETVSKTESIKTAAFKYTGDWQADFNDSHPLLPWMVFETVVEKRPDVPNEKVEAVITALTDKFAQVYKNNESWAQKILNGKGNMGRDTLYAFVNHWIDAMVKKGLDNIQPATPDSGGVNPDVGAVEGSKKTATGEMSADEVTEESYPLHFAIAKAFGGEVKPFDQYQGPYVSIGGDTVWLIDVDDWMYLDKEDSWVGGFNTKEEALEQAKEENPDLSETRLGRMVDKEEGMTAAYVKGKDQRTKGYPFAELNFPYIIAELELILGRTSVEGSKSKKPTPKEKARKSTLDKKAGIPEQHQLKILKDTVRNPNKGLFLGGPSAEESEQILRTKFNYTDKQIEQLKTGSLDKKADASDDVLNAKTLDQLKAAVEAMGYTVDENLMIKDPGKFESNWIATPYFWEMAMVGDNGEDMLDFGEGETYSYYKLSPEEQTMFKTTEPYFLLSTSSSGFVGGEFVSEERHQEGLAEYEKFETESGEEGMPLASKKIADSMPVPPGFKNQPKQTKPQMVCPKCDSELRASPYSPGAMMSGDQTPTKIRCPGCDTWVTPKQASKTAGSKAWDVVLDGKVIDTVWDIEEDPAEVKRSLVGHDGYDPNIVVQRPQKNAAVKTAEVAELDLSAFKENPDDFGVPAAIAQGWNDDEIRVYLEEKMFANSHYPALAAAKPKPEKIKPKGNLLVAYDSSDVYSNQVESNIEQIKADPESYGLDSKDLSDEIVKEKAEELAAGDSDVQQMAWDDEMSILDEVITNANKASGNDGWWDVEGRNMGWQQRSGEMKIEINNHDEFLKIFPDTQDVSFEVRDGGKNTLDVTIWHHDAPTGEFRTLIPTKAPDDTMASKTAAVNPQAKYSVMSTFTGTMDEMKATFPDVNFDTEEFNVEAVENTVQVERIVDGSGLSEYLNKLKTQADKIVHILVFDLSEPSGAPMSPESKQMEFDGWEQIEKGLLS